MLKLEQTIFNCDGGQVFQVFQNLKIKKVDFMINNFSGTLIIQLEH